MQPPEKKESRKIYRGRKVQMLLSKVLSGEIKTLEPIYTSEFGYRYPIVENIVGEATQI
jgi:hypothetical protein